MVGIITIVLICFFLPASGQETASFFNGKTELFYEVSGKGPALYILTGGPGAPPGDPGHRIMDSLKEHYTCVLLHQRGAGLSKNIEINAGTISINNYLEDIELLREKRKDRSISIIGISWGGLLAMNYAARHPSKVKNLVLVCSAPPSYKLWNVLFDNQFVRRSQIELDSMELLVKIFSPVPPATLDSLKRTQPGAKEVIAFKNFISIHMRAMSFFRRKPAGFDQFFKEFNFQPIPLIDEEVMQTHWDITADLKKINTPALILYGRQDDQGESTFYLQKESLRNSRMEVIEQCGHLMWEDQPEAFFRALKTYLVKKEKQQDKKQKNHH